MTKRNVKPPNLKIEEPTDGPKSPQLERFKTLESIGKAPSSPSLNINRTAYNVTQFNDDFIPIPTGKSEKLSKFKFDYSGKAWIRRLRGLFPISLWLPEYDYKQNLMADIIVGITIAIFQVPQSMGYCLIAHVPPVYGLYSSFFPALFYTILGTGMHCAFGPFAIVSGVMTGDIVIQVMKQLGKEEDNTPIGVHPTASSLIISKTLDSFAATMTETSSMTTIPVDDFPDLKNIEVAIMVAIIIGAFILAFGILQLGFISSFMSEELISGFTTSACVIVFFSQVRYLLGVNLGHFSGPGNLIIAIIEVFKRLDEINMTTLKISGICLTILLTFKLGFNRLTAKYGIKTPFPIELCVVIGGTLCSHLMRLKDAPYNVNIVGTIGNKFPVPLMPRYELFPIMWDKCIATAIVGYTITLSVCKIYGKKHGYKPDANQEMIAMGATNVISAFFQCIPAAASLPRSALQETAGGKTQVVSIVNCCCIVVVILALGRYLEELPVCVLGSCIAVALVSLITKVGEFKRFWKVSKLDGMIWLITFWAVLLVSVDIGIYIGLVCSLLLLIYKSERPKVYLLGTVNDLEIYVPINKFNKVVEPEGFKIFQMCGPLNFSNIEYFSNKLEDKCEVNVTSIQKFIKSQTFKKSQEKVELTSYESLSKFKLTRLALNDHRLPKYIVIDCSMYSFIDFSGITTLKKTIQTFEEIGIKVVLSGIQVHLESMLAKEGFFEDISTEHIYKSVHDAVVCLKEFDTDLKDQNTLKDNLNENHIYMKDITTQMDSLRNSFKSDTNSSANNSLRDEEIPDYDTEEVKTPRIHSYSSSMESPPPLSQVSTSQQQKSRSLPALYSLKLDSSIVDMKETVTPPSSPAYDYDIRDRNYTGVTDICTPETATTEIMNMSSHPLKTGPEPPPSPTITDEPDYPSSSCSDTKFTFDTPLEAIPVPPSMPPFISEHVPPTPPQRKSIPVPPPPPPPPTHYNKNPAKNALLKGGPRINFNRSSSEGDLKNGKQTVESSHITNKRISEKLRSRSEMLAKVLESRKISDA